MTYSTYCRTHRKVCTPVYWRPEGKTFKRIYAIVFCPGESNRGHLLKEIPSAYGPSTQNLTEAEHLFYS